MRKVREAFPREVIESIGAAPSIGWKRWYELAARLLDQKIDAASVHPAPFPAGLTSDQRFDVWSKLAMKAGKNSTTRKAQQAQPMLIKAQDGSVIGSIALQKGTLSFQATAKSDPFTAWLHGNAQTVFPRLHEEFLARTVKTE
jgi:ParB family chromosome partitioning protein